MKEILFTNWHLMRIFRLALALFLFTQAYNQQDWMFVAFGLFFLVQVIFNMGCGANGCAVPKNKYKENE